MASARAATLQRRSLYALVALVVLVLALYAFWPRPVEVEAATVDRGTVEVLVREEGRTRVGERFTIAAPVDGQLERIALEPGDRVRAGQELARIRPLRSSLLDPARRAGAEGEWEAASAERAAAAASLDAARAEAGRSAAELARLRMLAGRGLVATQALQQAEAAAVAAAANAEAAAARLRAAGSRASQARAQLDLQGGDSSDTAQAVGVSAPLDGVVLQRMRESAGPVRAGEPLLELGDTGRMEAVVEVLSADAVRIVPGTPVRLHRWGGGEPLVGTVQRVEPGGFTKVSALGVEEQRVRVVVDLPAHAGDPLRERLGDGYRVEGEFAVSQAVDVPRVPTSALFRTGGGWAVYRIADGRALSQAVEPGLLGAAFAEVRSGLDAGDVVVLYPEDAIADGLRVTVRAPR